MSTDGDDALTSSGSSGVQFAQLLLKLVCYSCGEGGGAKGGRGMRPVFQSFLALLRSTIFWPY